ncbi:Flp family type IVb pilin [Kerstersia gyiorum]|uniref:Pilus assembly protein Flp/PilA n=1 Tax=Kerstersia gyiorum TaxID=206506 RepID=A0A171KUZ3_9BURK|nr:Flp family type IVb pilin [Kerstersia gyiorum]KAB0543369.1 Flp family type IVb pilin [Kerstersia gyiorum]KKO72710.1 hypothetical protein AAV32_04470 [Kerstersia gyiorum]RZS70309.1 pilus assembly protein Flp/PilA [Kerstersia gyiorum]
MKEQIVRFLKDEDGATAIEYGLIAGLVAVLIIAAFVLFGDGLNELFTNIGSKLSDTAGKIN